MMLKFSNWKKSCLDGVKFEASHSSLDRVRSINNMNVYFLKKLHLQYENLDAIRISKPFPAKML